MMPPRSRGFWINLICYQRLQAEKLAGKQVAGAWSSSRDLPGWDGRSTSELSLHMAKAVTRAQSAQDGACAPTDYDGQEGSWEPSHIGGWGGI